MGSVYSIHSQMKFKDKDKAIKILQAKISRGEEEHTDYGLDTYRKSENLDINDVDDLIAVFIGVGKSSMLLTMMMAGLLTLMDLTPLMDGNLS